MLKQQPGRHVFPLEANNSSTSVNFLVLLICMTVWEQSCSYNLIISIYIGLDRQHNTQTNASTHHVACQGHFTTFTF